MQGPVEFVFSFRSPYVWIAARHVLPMLHPATEVRWTPFFPLPSFRNFGGRLVRGKVRHNVEDILRLCEAYGLPIGRPSVDEPDWVRPHAAFLHADRAGQGPAFARALLDERWEHGRLAGDESSIRRAAEAAGLDAVDVAKASADPDLQAEVTDLVQRNYDERDIFGVPMFILPDGSRFWGHDRMEWALRYGFLRGAA